MDGGVHGGESCACVLKTEVRLCATQGSAKTEDKIATRQRRRHFISELEQGRDPATSRSLVLTVNGGMNAFGMQFYLPYYYKTTGLKKKVAFYLKA